MTTFLIKKGNVEMKLLKRLFLTLTILFISLISFGQNNDWINITPNQVSQGWAGAYSNPDVYGNVYLVVYYQVWRSTYQIDGQYWYYIYFFSGFEKAVVLKQIDFYAYRGGQKQHMGNLASFVVPTDRIHVYSIYSPYSDLGIGFSWQNYIRY